MKKVLIFLIIMLMIISVGCEEKDNRTEEEKIKDRQIMELVIGKKYNLAKNKARELYSEDKEKIDDILEFINAVENDNKQEKEKILLEIQPKWKWIKKRDYTYIQGKVKNISNVNISYFEIIVEYLGKNDEILDTDYTNSREIIKPNSLKEFEIMHKYNEEYQTIRLYPSNIRVE